MPLSCYHAFAQNLFLKINGDNLEKVLVCRDEAKAKLVSTPIVEGILQQIFGSEYAKMEPTIHDWLVSSLCIKLANPDLPDYSLLMMPEVRSIEALLKAYFKKQGHEIGKEGFKGIFTRNPKSRSSAVIPLEKPLSSIVYLRA